MKHLLFMYAIATGACVTEPDKPLPPEQQPGDTDGSDDEGQLVADPDLSQPAPTTPGDDSCHLRRRTVDCQP